jgi:hypothetical protein
LDLPYDDAMLRRFYEGREKLDFGSEQMRAEDLEHPSSSTVFE